MSSNSSSSSLCLVTSPPEEYRIAVIGDTGSGKSSLVIRICYGFFDEHEPRDPEAAELHRKRTFLDGKECVLEMMDTAYPEEGSSPAEKWIEESDAVVIAYNVSKLPWRSTPLKNIRKYHEVVKLVKERQNVDWVNFPVLILGTHNDRIEERVLEAKEAQSLADELGCAFAECSALERDVEKPIYDLMRYIRDQRPNLQRELESISPKTERKRDRLRGARERAKSQLEEVAHKAWIFG